MSCVTIGGQEVSARSMLPPSKRRLIGGLFNKSKQSPRDHNRQLLQQNLPIATNSLRQPAPELPAPPRVHERRAIRKADGSRDGLEPLSVRLVATYAFGPMARHNARLDVVNRDHVGAAIADSRRYLNKIRSTSR